MKEYDDEEAFHAIDGKQHKKERKLAQSTDRSKYKKTDRDKVKKLDQEASSHLPRGRVIAITGEGISVDYDSEVYLCSLKGLLKKEKSQSKNLIATGDWVRFSPSGKEGAITYIEERTSFLGRTDISGRKEQLIAVNIDQVIISASIVEPPLKPALIDRYLIAAEKGGLHPIIVINKIDLLESAGEVEKEMFREFLLAYEPLGIPILSLSVENKTGIEALRSLLQNKSSVFSGQSGVGKSSLLNACFGLTLKTGDLAMKTQKGRHTTTTAELLPLPGGGYCVDTPGIRSFGIWDLQKDEIIAHFRDLSHLGKRCKFPDCIHINEPYCAVLEGLEEGKIHPLRYESYRTLIEGAINGADKQTWS